MFLPVLLMTAKVPPKREWRELLTCDANLRAIASFSASFFNSFMTASVAAFVLS
jgi:hypothetical protein